MTSLNAENNKKLKKIWEILTFKGKSIFRNSPFESKN